MLRLTNQNQVFRIKTGFYIKGGKIAFLSILLYAGKAVMGNYVDM